VTITGTGLSGATAVSFGGTAATSVTVVSDTSVTALTPGGIAGLPVDVVVVTVGATATKKAAFAYVVAPTLVSVAPSTGPAAGGTSVTITGTGLTGATSVSFGGIAAGYIVVSETQISAVTPGGSPGPVDVVVATVGGTATKTGGFGYVPVPTLASVSPAGGPTGGGTSVTITGTGFTGATSVSFGSSPAAGFVVNSDTQITALSSAHSAGSVDVTVATPGGTATKTSGFGYGLPPV
jgi:hypothetical protein